MPILGNRQEIARAGPLHGTIVSVAQTDLGWYRRNLKSMRILTEPVVDQVCEWLHQRYDVNPEHDYDGLSPGWRYFIARAPSLRRPDFRPWRDFLRPVPGWRAVRNAEPGEPGWYEWIAGPVLNVTVNKAESSDELTRYLVEMGEVIGPDMGRGGEIEVAVAADGSVNCRAIGLVWIA